MDWLNIVISGVAAIVGAIGSGSIFFVRQNKTAKKIENEAAQSAEWRKLYEEMKTELSERDSKIDRLYDEIKEHRNEKNAMSKRITDLEVENTKSRIYRCEVAGCAKRQPPTGY